MNVGGERKKVYLEITRTELTQVIRELEGCKKEMDNIQAKIDEKNGDKQ